MPKLKCQCGFVHNLSPIPDDGWITIRDVDYEKVIGAEITQHEISRGGLPYNENPRASELDEATGVISAKSGSIYECPNCGRIMWAKPLQEGFTVYFPENAAAEHVVGGNGG